MPVTLPLAEWTPDLPALNNTGLTVARNVVPATPISYGPIPSLIPFTGNRSINPIPPLSEQPFSLYSYLDRNTNEHIIAGTAHKLYQFKTGDSQFKDVSGDRAPFTATAYDPWTLVSFGNSIIATNGNDAPQVMNLDTDTEFSDLNTFRAPFGKYACVCRDFMVFANVIEPQDNTSYPQRLHWSAIGDAASYPDLGSLDAAQLSSDAQDLRSDLGHIRGIGSNLQAADMVVLLDYGVYSVRYVGSPATFEFQVMQGAVGCQVPGSVVVNRGYIYYLGLDGFVACDGTSPNLIGANKIDKWFFNDPVDGVDTGYLYQIRGSADPTGRLIMWTYSSKGSGGVNNRLLIYNWMLARWSMARLNVPLLGRGLSTGYSLDQLDQFGNMETLTPSLDDPYWQGGRPYLLAFDNNQVMSFSGPNIAAIIETQEGQLTPPGETASKRSRITNVKPLVDGGTPYVSLGYRQRNQDAVVYADPVRLNAYGNCPQRVDARYVRGRVSLNAGDAWNHISGLEVDFAASTYR